MAGFIGDMMVNIRSVYNQFTRAEKKVADYVLEHAHEVVFMSITELADACGIGDTSVFRFCRTIGSDGYQEFKMHLSASIQKQGQEDGVLTGNVQPEDDVGVMVQKVLGNSLRSLSETAGLLDLAALSLVTDYLLEAGRIAFFGVGASWISAQKAANKFLRVEPKVICPGDAHIQAMQASTLAHGDAALVFSYSGSTKDTNAVARLARNAGAKVIAVTRFKKSPLTEFTDVTLLCGANESPMQGGSSGADICQTFLMDLLFTNYYRRNLESCNKVNERTTASVLNKLY